MPRCRDLLVPLQSQDGIRGAVVVTSLGCDLPTYHRAKLLARTSSAVVPTSRVVVSPAVLGAAPGDQVIALSTSVPGSE